MKYKGLFFGIPLTLSVFTIGSHVAIAGVKIGILNDTTGLYSSVTGPGSIIAAKMAVADFGGEVLGEKIEVVAGDHKQKPDIGASIARRWYDAEGVDAIFDIYHGGVGLAVQKIAEDKNKLVIFTTVSNKLTGDACSRNGMQWGADAYALATLSVKGMMSKSEQTSDIEKSWYFITVDYTSGHTLEEYASNTVEELGGTVLGSVRYPLETTDFSSYLLQAQGSNAGYIGYNGGGANTINIIKQVNEFQIQNKEHKFVPTSLGTSDIDALGSDVTQGMPVVMSFYWDMDDQTRAWAQRFEDIHGSMPTDLQANVYSAVFHYLKGVKKADSKETDKIINAMHEEPVNDFFTKNAKIRADGRLMRDMYVGEVKAPEDMSGPKDIIKIANKFSGEESFMPVAKSDCALLK